MPMSPPPAPSSPPRMYVESPWQIQSHPSPPLPIKISQPRPYRATETERDKLQHLYSPTTDPSPHSYSTCQREKPQTNQAQPPPPQAAAPQPPQIIPNESVTTSTSSLVDVDSQSVRTVPSDFLEQDVQTETQQARLERERDEQAAREKARQKKEAAKKKAARADSWVLSRLAALSDGQAGALAAANVALVVGLSGVLGYKAWGLHERGQFSWKTAGIGAGIVGVIGVVEGVFGRYVPSLCP